MMGVVYLSVLKTVMAKKGYQRSDVARAAGVSRQAVSLWFTQDDDFHNLHVANLLNLSDGLGIDPAEFLKPLPGISEPATVRRLYAEFCWDRSYPDIYSFLVALAGSRPRAVARFIECRGIYEAAAVLGMGVWRAYRGIRKHLAPAKREEIDTVWKVHHDLTRP